MNPTTPMFAFLFLVGWQQPVENPLIRCRQDLAKCQTESRGLAARIDRLTRSAADLNSKIREAQQEIERCRGQNGQMSRERDEARRQLAGLTQARDSLQRQLDEARLELKRQADSNSEVNAQFADLQKRSGNLDVQLASLNNQISADKQTIAALSSQLMALGQSGSTTASELTEAASRRAAAQPEGQVVARYEENDQVHLIRELVIGTLHTIYPKEVKGGAAFTLKAIFRPHPIITPGTFGRATQEAITWYIDLQYASQRSQVSYDRSQSGEKIERRQVDPSGSEETWAWRVLPPESFDSDLSDLIVYAEYETRSGPGDRKDIVHEPIGFSEMTEPGVLSSIFGLIKENISYLLGLLSIAVGIWATIIGTKKDKLEVRLKELELRLKAGGQNA
jgi:hypothetical protein